MPLYIRDDEVDALALQVQQAGGARTKTEAVRQALRHELRRLRGGMRPSERLRGSLALADAMGPGCDDFDMKAFRDEMWRR